MRPFPIVSLVIALVVGCGEKDTPTPPASTTPALAVAQPWPASQGATIRRTIVRWLDCEECTNGELSAVTALGQSAVSTLAVTLRDGPSPATREKLKLRLESNYPKMRAYVDTHPESQLRLRINQADYVQVHLDNQEARYRARSAKALATIGGNDARQALVGTLDREHLRPEVRQELLKALDQIRGP